MEQPYSQYVFIQHFFILHNKNLACNTFNLQKIFGNCINMCGNRLGPRVFLISQTFDHCLYVLGTMQYVAERFSNCFRHIFRAASQQKNAVVVN